MYNVTKLVGGDKLTVGPTLGYFLKQCAESWQGSVGVPMVDRADKVHAVGAYIGRLSPTECCPDMLQALVHAVDSRAERGFEQAVAHQVYQSVGAASSLETAPVHCHPFVVADRYLLAYGALEVFHTYRRQMGLEVGVPLVGGGDERLRPVVEQLLKHVGTLFYDGCVASRVFW